MHLDALKVLEFPYATMQIDSDLSQADDDALSESRRKRQQAGTRPPHPERTHLRNQWRIPYAPRYKLYELSLNEFIYAAEPLKDISRAAAQGLMEAQRRRFFETPSGQRMWAKTLSRIWYSVLATDAKNATELEKLEYLHEKYGS